jgi:flagellar motor switch/type III secretory pathway protein FliN
VRCLIARPNEESHADASIDVSTTALHSNSSANMPNAIKTPKNTKQQTNETLNLRAEKQVANKLDANNQSANNSNQIYYQINARLANLEVNVNDYYWIIRKF